jgi:hypothetical protein
MRTWTVCGVMLLSGALLGSLSGCSHNPNHDIDMEKARAAASRVHKPPPPGAKMEPGGGG